MPGEASRSTDGPRDVVPFTPRWALPHLSDDEYRRLRTAHYVKQGRSEASAKALGEVIDAARRRFGPDAEER